MLQSTDQIAVTLTAVQWNQVLAVLAKGPWDVVNPLIGAISAQALAHDGAADLPTEAPHVPH
ncbi:MAG TPA: hypothetical protein VLN57_19520 [Xanthobacteraceae bacterium]|nr:hypothetical protein [Xanthobacteraceae bacterium]